MTLRSQTRPIQVGSLTIGGGAPVSVQTMATADPHDAGGLVDEILRCAAAGADVVRLTVPDREAAVALAQVRKQVTVPLVADIHFDYRLALAAVDAGCDALRLNPGNIGSIEHVREVAHQAQLAHVPIRIGVNGGSLEKDILVRYGSATAQALVDSALRHIRVLEDVGFGAIAVSVKASDVSRTLAAYRLLAEKVDYPLHLGVTEAGTFVRGTVHSSVALGILLAQGLGDTIRVSLTDRPEKEVQVGLEILRALGLRAAGPAVTSCPTCGRTQVPVARVAEAIEQALSERLCSGTSAGPHVAVMGCVVNGPGEARDADIALCGGKGEFLVYERGELVDKVPEAGAVEAVLVRVAAWQGTH